MTRVRGASNPSFKRLQHMFPFQLENKHLSLFKNQKKGMKTCFLGIALTPEWMKTQVFTLVKVTAGQATLINNT